MVNGTSSRRPRRNRGRGGSRPRARRSPQSGQNSIQPRSQARRLQPARAAAAASTVAKFCYPRHPIAKHTGWIGGGTTQPTFKFSKRVRVIRTAGGTATENLVLTPNAADDVADVHIRNLNGATCAAVIATPDTTFIGSGSLFSNAQFSTGELENRMIGIDVTITPLGARLNMAGAIQAVLSHEDHLDSAVAIDTLISQDIRSKRVPKVPGKPVSFTSFHHDLDTVMGMGVTATPHFYAATDPLLAITIPSDGTAAVQYSLDIVTHWEVAGTSVAQVASPNLHDAPLLEKIHHEASTLHTMIQGAYIDPAKTADIVAKKSTGFSFTDLVKMAGGVANFIVGGSAIADSLTSAAFSAAVPTLEAALPLMLAL